MRNLIFFRILGKIRERICLITQLLGLLIQGNQPLFKKCRNQDIFQTNEISQTKYFNVLFIFCWISVSTSLVTFNVLPPLQEINVFTGLPYSSLPLYVQVPIPLIIFHQNSNLIQILFCFHPNSNKWSVQNFAHGMTAQLSCHVQKFVAIKLLWIELQQKKALWNLNCTWKIAGEMDLSSLFSTPATSPNTQHTMGWDRHHLN